MGVFESKFRNTHQDTSQESETPPSKVTKPAVSQRELIYWEKVYKERFAREFIFSTFTDEPLHLPFAGRPMASEIPSWEWRLDSDCPSSSKRYNPRYIGATPEPVSRELADQTRCELKKAYHRSVTLGWLRGWLKEAWLPHWSFIPRVPYLTDGVIFPHASQIKNGHILPARVRSYISGEPEETPFGRDAFSMQKLEKDPFWTGDPPPIRTWLNQTTAIYFEPEFEERGPNYTGVPYIGRGIFAAWHEVVRERGEEPNIQQMRYFANPVMLLGGPKPRPIADIIATHRRICDAVADAQDTPVSPKDSYSWVEHGTELRVIYPSIIIVVDDARNSFRGGSEAESREIMFTQLSVLLVRTGNEEHLSEPIDFSGLGGTTLPLNREELLQDNQQVVRVRLDTAVRFIMDLERREQVRCPRLLAMKNILDEDTFRQAEKYAADVLAMAEKNGSIDRNFDTWEAVRRARACLDGDELYHYNPKVPEWDKQIDYCGIHFW